MGVFLEYVFTRPHAATTTVRNRHHHRPTTTGHSNHSPLRLTLHRAAPHHSDIRAVVPHGAVAVDRKELPQPRRRQARWVAVGTRAERRDGAGAQSWGSEGGWKLLELFKKTNMAPYRSPDSQVKESS